MPPPTPGPHGPSPLTFDVDKFIKGNSHESNVLFKTSMEYLTRNYPESLGIQDREDITQEALRQSIRYLKGGGILEGDFPVWFRSVVNHRAIEHLRKKNGAQRLKLINKLDDESELPRRGRFLVVVAAVRSLLHFRTFSRRGQIRHDVNEIAFPDQTRAIGALRERLVGLWPPGRPSKGEARAVIVAVEAILGLRLDTDLAPETPADCDPMPEERAMYAETIASLRNALKRLDPDQLAVVTKHAFEGYSLRESARLLNMSQAMGQRIWHGALRVLRRELGDSHP